MPAVAMLPKARRSWAVALGFVACLAGGLIVLSAVAGLPTYEQRISPFSSLCVAFRFPDGTWTDPQRFSRLAVSRAEPLVLSAVVAVVLALVSLVAAPRWWRLTGLCGLLLNAYAGIIIINWAILTPMLGGLTSCF